MCYMTSTLVLIVNKLSKPEPDSEKATALPLDARRRAAMADLVALLKETSAEAEARGFSMTQAEIDEEMALYKAERHG